MSRTFPKSIAERNEADQPLDIQSRSSTHLSERHKDWAVFNIQTPSGDKFCLGFDGKIMRLRQEYPDDSLEGIKHARWAPLEAPIEYGTITDCLITRDL